MPPARRPEFEPVFGSRSSDTQFSSPQAGAAGVGAAGVGAAGVGDRDIVPADPVEGPPGEPRVAPAMTDRVEETTPQSSGDLVDSLTPPRATSPGPTEPDPSDLPHLPDRPDPSLASVDVPPASEALDPTPAEGESTVPRPPGVRWFRIRQRIIAVVALAILLGLAYYLVSLFQVWSTGRADDDGPVDAIVVMGAAQYDGRPSPQLAARLDHVVELWPEGIAPLVVVTGGNIPGDRFTEAEASATYLTERGVPVEALLLENAGSNSYETLDAVADLLAARGLDEVLIVTDPYHALRSRLIAEEVGLSASVSSTDTSVVTGGESLKRHLEEAAGVAVGRIIGFDRLTRLVD